MKPNFSVVLIARNEEKTLPRLLESLGEFRERGGEVVLVDTGSSDSTAEIARASGCIVDEVGDRFQRVITDNEANQINWELDLSDKAVVEEADRLFDYSAARNHAATLASNDMIATPDCDEVYTKLDLDAIEDALQHADQLEYNFVFSHDADGNELIKFMHSKFYNRTKLKWVGIIHEVLQAEKGVETSRVFLEESVIKLEHWQNMETNRSHYLKGLALDVFLNPENDRNLHYYGRELLYTGRFKSAIKILEKHIAMNRWVEERAQSMLHIGEAKMAMGDIRGAIHAWTDAFDICPTRREPLMKIAEFYRGVGSVDHVIAYTAAALQVPEGSFYANFQPYYENVPHELMYWALWEKNELRGAKQHFDICLALQPFNPKYLHDFRNYYELPKMSFVIPTLRGEEALARTVDSIKALNYPQDKIEILIEKDEPRIGVAKRLKEGVKKATGKWIVYAADDMEFHPDSIMCAFKTAMDNNKHFMAFNSGPVSPDEGNICEHFMINVSLVEKIGDIFDTDFHHVGVDNLLWAKMKKLRQNMRCGRAIVTHHHFTQGAEMDEVHKLGWDPVLVAQDRELLGKKLEEVNKT